MRPIILLFSLACFCPRIMAQEPVRTFEPYRPPVVVVDTPATYGAQPPLTAREGRLVWNSAPEVDRLMQDYVAHKHPMQGFRVQIFLGNDRRVAEETKRAFLAKFPETAAYLSWLAPNFRLRVGDLRTRLEAERLLHELRPLYPGSYIVPDEIEMPPLPVGH
jgi:hypothetical protein